jgi:nucleoside-diphosphate-sugar epimerase
LGMKQTILATGGTGYIGSWVVKGLLENGHIVRLTVRQKSDSEKYQGLAEIAETNEGSLEIWEADLLKEGSFDEAAEGCDTIIHMASPFILKIKNAQRELVDPAVKGTANVLSAANKSSSVKKVVLTSSIAATYGDAIDMSDQNLSAITEQQFNTTSSLTHNPYSYSKVEAEKKAWEIAKQQSSWELVVLNPVFVMGPSLSSHSQSESLKMMREMLAGKFKMGVAELYFGWVDVRDVAKAHIYCAENQAEGRHILSERVLIMLSYVDIVRKYTRNPKRMAKSNMPKWLIKIVGGLFGLTRKFVENNVGVPVEIDSSKSREKLGLKYTPMEQTVEDMVAQIEAKEG